ncbi:uncharacterized protein TNCV_4380531 [Trichonephila clavipes]|nr:uncharacterized protein TNCV_4380531 [Trichonephila clavipes]
MFILKAYFELDKLVKYDIPTKDFHEAVHQVVMTFRIRRASRPGKQFNLVIDEDALDNTFPMWSRIILLKYGCGQVLNVRKDNWLQHLGDAALAV